MKYRAVKYDTLLEALQDNLQNILYELLDEYCGEQATTEAECDKRARAITIAECSMMQMIRRLDHLKGFDIETLYSVISISAQYADNHMSEIQREVQQTALHRAAEEIYKSRMYAGSIKYIPELDKREYKVYLQLRNPNSERHIDYTSTEDQ